MCPIAGLLRASLSLFGDLVHIKNFGPLAMQCICSYVFGPSHWGPEANCLVHFLILAACNSHRVQMEHSEIISWVFVNRHCSLRCTECKSNYSNSNSSNSNYHMLSSCSKQADSNDGHMQLVQPILM